MVLLLWMSVKYVMDVETTLNYVSRTCLQLVDTDKAAGGFE